MLGPDNTLFTTLLANAKNLHRHHFVAKKWRHEEEEVEREERRRFANVKRLIEQKVRSDTGLGISGIRWFGKNRQNGRLLLNFLPKITICANRWGNFKLKMSHCVYFPCKEKELLKSYRHAKNLSFYSKLLQNFEENATLKLLLLHKMQHFGQCYNWAKYFI